MAQYFLIVDDEKPILNALRRELRNWAAERDLEIVPAGSGEEALAFLEDNHLQTVLLMSDQKMPGMKGHELLETCARQYPDLVLLMLTGYTEINDVVKTIRAGVYSFILKPWDHDDLIYEVSKAYNIHENRQAHEAYLKLFKNQSDLARVLADAISPEVDEDTGGWRIVSRTARSHAREPNGVDYHAVVPLGEQHRLLLAGHVESDPIRSALLAGTSMTALMRALHREGENPASVSLPILLRAMHTALQAATRAAPDIMVGCTLGMLDTASATLLYTGGGHPDWLLLRGDGFAELEITGPGLDAGGEFPRPTVRRLALESGDRLVVAGPAILAGYEDDKDTRRLRVLARDLRARLQEQDLGGAVDDLVGEQRSGSEATDRALTVVTVP